MLGDQNLVRLMGGVEILVAMIFLSVQYTFSKDWATLIPIIGWIAFIEGTMLLWYPSLPKKMWKKIGSEHSVALMSILGIILAVALCYVAKELLPGYEIV